MMKSISLYQFLSKKNSSNSGKVLIISSFIIKTHFFCLTTDIEII
jgi:hypothetical protein